MNATEFEDIRWRLKMNQVELAKELGVHPVTVNKWERGSRKINRMVELAMRGLLCEQERTVAGRAPTGATGKGEG